MGLDEDFNAAAERVKKFKTRPSDNDLLEIYAFFKQATIGDNNTSKPGALDLKAKAKWEAWSNVKGTDKNAAKQKYISKVQSLEAKHG